MQQQQAPQQGNVMGMQQQQQPQQQPNPMMQVQHFNQQQGNEPSFKVSFRLSLQLYFSPFKEVEISRCNSSKCNQEM
jgi:hypothetical protein